MVRFVLLSRAPKPAKLQLRRPLLDQDSERTSSLLAPGKSSVARRQSRAPGSGIVAGIDELDALGTLSLRPSQANVVPLKQPSNGASGDVVSQASSAADATFNADASVNGADDMTIVAHSGRAGVASESEAATRDDESLPNVRGLEAASAGLAPASADSGVNPKHSLQPRQRVKPSTSARRSSKSPKTGRWLALQWAFAGATITAAVWYVLQQPASQSSSGTGSRVAPTGAEHWGYGR